MNNQPESGPKPEPAAESHTLFYKPAGDLWDTVVYHYRNQFYLYYSNGLPASATDLAISNDGVHWEPVGSVLKPDKRAIHIGTGDIWRINDNASGGDKFITNFAEANMPDSDAPTWITAFAESYDLINWRRLDKRYDSSADARWYAPDGRWDSMWTTPRPGGGRYGYLAATPKDETVGIGFAESLDGITWQALPPPALPGVARGRNPHATSPEVCAAYAWNGKHYLLAGLDDLQGAANEDLSVYNPGVTTLVGDSPAGPFLPATKNRRLLVGNASYFMRFVETPDGVLANHHSWAIERNDQWGAGINPGKSYMAPLKKAVWDDEGILRLMWWEGNDRVKHQPLNVPQPTAMPGRRWAPLELPQNPDATLILEGRVTVPTISDAQPTGLFFPGKDGNGTGFLIRTNGIVEYGPMNQDGSGFERAGHVDREVALQESASFRLIRKGRLTELYLDDYLMQCYCLPERSSWQLVLLGTPDSFQQLAAWHA